MLQNSQSSIMESATATEGRGGSRTRKFEMVIVMVRMMKVMIFKLVMINDGSDDVGHVATC